MLVSRISNIGLIFWYYQNDLFSVREVLRGGYLDVELGSHVTLRSLRSNLEYNYSYFKFF